MSLPLTFSKPWMNAAGSLGFAPDLHGAVDLDAFGAFVTNPISLRPRRAARPPRLAAHPQGALLHSGHPNPGFSRALRRYAARWRRAPLPVIVHLLAEHPDDLRRMLPRLEEVENVYAVEVGLPPDCDAGLATDLLTAAWGELPIIARISAEQARDLAPAMMAAGASAVSLGAPRAGLELEEGATMTGRLYGPALFENTLALSKDLMAEEIPLIASGGIYHREQGQALLEAGALAVQLDTVLWKAGNW